MATSPERPSAVRAAAARPSSPLRRLATTPDEAFQEIDGRSPAIESLKSHMRCVARDPFVTVLLLGESGAGKERIAGAIHRASPRRGAPFVVVNCAGLSPTLVEDELFGHVRGAFTGATSDRPGPFERAAGGTVFLDEVGDLTPELQIKLLRALQERTVQRLGSDRETAFDVRVIAATNADLASAVARRRFREDLYYRLKVYELRVPSLRERGTADLRALVDSMLARLTERRQRLPVTIEASAFDLLAQYDWPGNVRELENTLERMVVAADEGSPLTRAHLPDGFNARRGKAEARSNGCAEPSAPASVEEVRAALERNAFRYGRAATELGMSRHQLYRLLKRRDAASTIDRS